MELTVFGFSRLVFLTTKAYWGMLEQVLLTLEREKKADKTHGFSKNAGPTAINFRSLLIHDFHLLKLAFVRYKRHSTIIIPTTPVSYFTPWQTYSII